MIASGPKSLSELRKFGLAFGGGLSLLGAALVWRDRIAAPYVLAGAGLVLLLALAWPRALTPLEWLLARLFRLVTAGLTYVVLVLVFLLVLTPLGFVRRLLGQESLGLSPDPDRESYWVDVDPDGPGSRPGKPF